MMNHFLSRDYQHAMLASLSFLGVVVSVMFLIAIPVKYFGETVSGAWQASNRISMLEERHNDEVKKTNNLRTSTTAMTVEKIDLTAMPGSTHNILFAELQEYAPTARISTSPKPIARDIARINLEVIVLDAAQLTPSLEVLERWNVQITALNLTVNKSKKAPAMKIRGFYYEGRTALPPPALPTNVTQTGNPEAADG